MSLKRFFAVLALCVVFVQVGLQCARAEPPYEVTLEDEFGNHLPTFRHRGELFAMGRQGQRYNVRITNHSGRRVEAVVTVDGRDVISGRPGDYKRQVGYIVPAYGSVVIDGFRTSLSEVAAFRFSDPSDSYSARMGTPENVGIIGAAFFPEAAPPPPRPRPQIPYRRDEAPRSESKRGSYGRQGAGGLGTAGEGSGGGGRASSAPAAAEAAPAPERSTRDRGYDYGDDDRASNIGTEYGEAQYSSVVEVPFQRARPSSPERVVTLRYDDREGLEARGILTRPAPEPRRPVGPVAFPQNRFAPPPPRPY